MVLVDYIGIFFYMRQYFWPHTVDVDTIFSHSTYQDTVAVVS